MKRLIALTLLLIASFALVFPASADYVFDFDEDGCELFDFTSAQGDWVNLTSAGWTSGTIGTYSAGVGFVTTDYTGSYPRARRIILLLEIEPTVIENITIVYDYTQGSWNNSSTWALAVNNVGGTDATNYSPPVETKNSITNGTNKTKFIDYPGDSKGIIALDLRASVMNSGSVSGSATIKSIEVCGVPPPDEPILRPLESQHEDPTWGLFDWTDDGGFVEGGSEYTVSAMSLSPGAPVHSVIDGTVTSVEKLSVSECSNTLGMYLGVFNEFPTPITTLGCTVFIPPSVTGFSAPALYFLRTTFPPSPGDVMQYGLTVSDMYVVEVDGSDGYTYEYFVADASVEEGQEISAGCILGVTKNLTASTQVLPVLGWVLDLVVTNNTNQGFAAVTRIDSDPIELLPDLSIYPGPNSKCNQDPDFVDCLGDSKLESSGDWTSAGEVTWLEPGVQLGPFGGIAAVFNLEADREPQMRVSARAATGNPTLDLRLGDATESLPITSDQFEEYSIDAGPHGPNNGLFYDITARNTASSGIIEIEWLCVSFTLDGEGEPVDPEGEPAPPPFPENCEAITEPVGDDFGEWTSWHWHNLSQFFDCTLMIFLNMQYRTLTDFFQTITWTIRWFMAVFVQGVDWMGEDFIPWLGGYLANSSGRAGFTFSNLPIVSSMMGMMSEESVYAIQACDWNDLNCHIGGLLDGLAGDITDWLNQAAEDISGFFNDASQRIADALNSVSSFITEGLNWIVEGMTNLFNQAASAAEYHLSNLWNGISRLLLDIWDRLSQALEAIKGFLQEIINRLVEFLERVLGGLIGGVVDFLEYVFNTAVRLAEAIISSIIWVITEIVETIIFIRDLVFGIIDAWNTSDPTSIPGVTVCEAASYSIAICWAYWALENTIFTGPVGGIIIPLLTAIGIVIAAIRFVKDVRKTFLDTVQRMTA